MNFLNKFPNVLALSTKPETQITQEMIAKANADLAEAKITGVTLLSREAAEAAQANADKVADLQTKLDAATANATTSADKITALEQEVTKLKADNQSAGDNHTSIQGKKTETDGADPQQTAYNASSFDFNQRANKALGKS